MTQGFVPLERRLPSASAATDIAIEAPPELPRSASPGLLPQLLPVVLSVVHGGRHGGGLFLQVGRHS